MAKSKSRLPTKSVEPVVMPTLHHDNARERRYKAEDGLRTLQKAEECRKDKSLMKDIKALAREQMKAVSK